MTPPQNPHNTQNPRFRRSQPCRPGSAECRRNTAQIPGRGPPRLTLAVAGTRPGVFLRTVRRILRTFCGTRSRSPASSLTSANTAKRAIPRILRILRSHTRPTGHNRHPAAPTPSTNQPQPREHHSRCPPNADT